MIPSTMPSDATVSPSTLVARFLRTNGYTDTLSAFIREARLPRDAGSNTGSGSWTIEKIIDEKKAYDKTLNFERLGDGEGERDKWTLPGELGILCLDFICFCSVTTQNRTILLHSC